MKLYKAKYDDGSIVYFEGEPLVCNNPSLFYYLIDIENKSIDRFDKVSEDAEAMFGRPMPRSTRKKMSEPTIVELTEQEVRSFINRTYASRETIEKIMSQVDPNA